MEKLFVYGTLGPGRPNAHVMEAIGGTWADATVNGKLREAGWGAEMGYPGIDLDENGDEINGFVFSSENLSAHWEELDQFEGEAYERVLVPVKLSDGNMTEAYIYMLRPE
ncbi:gamma-glutamylcyclotransferase family protein [Photobacterium sp. J15]|uniref:gamma-glutamylcyclotransferase family protein n=1 Tax=Photobacterium sp. J15 TaxID=265901 RepID=UPI0007E4B617|nr:gamma-glutamylcyclotransferase family protein [Photobacterium sp. J15]